MVVSSANNLTDINYRKDKINKKFIMLISIVAALGGLLFGFDTAIISGAIPYIKNYFGLNEYMLGWAVSCILLGCASGALLAGKLADSYGRRYVLIICAVLFAISGIGAGASGNLWIFVIFRFIGGLGVGAAAMVSPMYIAETVPPAWRGRLVSLYQLAIVSGILLAYFSNFILADTGVNNWRWMFASQALPAIIFGLLLLMVPETPRWLVKKDRRHEALNILTKIGGTDSAVMEITQIENSFHHEKTKISSLFTSRNLPVVCIGITIAVLQQITGINAILYYAPVIFKETGLGINTSLLQTIGIGVVNVLSTFIAIGLVDKVGRKKFFLTGCVLMCISLLAVAACFHFHYFKNYLVLLSVLVYVASFGCTLGAVTWVFLSEIFPNNIRGLALSVATLALWLADFAVTYMFPILIRNYGTSKCLLIYAVFCIIAFVYILIKVPETKGKSLEEIEQLFINKK